MMARQQPQDNGEYVNNNQHNIVEKVINYYYTTISMEVDSNIMMKTKRRGWEDDDSTMVTLYTTISIASSSKILTANIQQSEWKFRQEGIVNNKMTMMAKMKRWKLRDDNYDTTTSRHWRQGQATLTDGRHGHSLYWGWTSTMVHQTARLRILLSGPRQ